MTNARNSIPADGGRSSDVGGPAAAGRARSERDILADSGLPQPLRDTVARITRRTRLWPRERRAVAQELVAHFADGLEAGAAAEQLLDRFGDPGAAARLIRRAKRRQRPMLWHAARRFTQVVAALMLAYVVYGVWLAFDRPVVRIDYLAQLNGPILATAPDERAWPFYAEAIRALRQMPKEQRDELTRVLLSARPGDADWPRAQQWLRDHARVVDLLDRASRQPHFGFVLGPEGSEFGPGNPFGNVPASPAAEARPALYDAMQTSVRDVWGEARLHARILVADARRALHQGDGDLFVRRIENAMGVARHCGHTSTLIGDLVGLGVSGLALAEVGDAIRRNPDALSDAHLRRLVALVDDARFAADLVGLSGERLLFHDFVQRAYTDDGEGDGRLSGSGLLGALNVSGAAAPSALQRVGAAGLGPVIAVAMPSRRETVQHYERFIQRAVEALGRPYRSGAWDAIVAEYAWSDHSRARSVRQFLLTTLAPGLRRAHVSAERQLAARDAVLTAIALELHRRAAGSYPKDLTEVRTDLSPWPRPDPVDGEPLRYRLAEGRPLLYSVGIDGDDDGGRGPGRERERQVMLGETPAADGDWVLFPASDED